MPFTHLGLRSELLAAVKSAVERFDSISNNTRLLSQTMTMNHELQKTNRALEDQVARLAAENARSRQPSGQAPLAG